MYLDKIIGKGIPITVIIELILSNLAYMVVLAVPMAVLVSTLMVFGAFSESNEFTATRASGIHPFRVMLPMIIGGTLLFLAMVFFSNFILPEANYRARALFIDIRMKKPGFDLKEGVFYDGIEGYTFLVQQKPSETDSLFGITLFQEARDGKDEALIKAEKGFLSSENTSQSLKLVLWDGEMFRTIRPKGSSEKTIEKTRFGSYSLSFDLSKLEFSRSNPESRGRNDRTMRAEAMFEVIQTLENEMQREAENALQQNGSMAFLAKLDSSLQSTNSPIPVNQRQHLTKPLGEPRVFREPFASSFISLNQVESFERQRDILRNAVRGIRARSVNYEGVNNTRKWKEERQAKYWVEIHKKIAIPFGALLFVFIGAPIGLLTRKGNLGVAAVISALVFTFYWIGIIQGEKLADRLIISPGWGMWGINMIYAIFACFLMLKISRGYLWKKRTHELT
jgi:lipopolysaccharide export system permease protein